MTIYNVTRQRISAKERATEDSVVVATFTDRAVARAFASKMNDTIEGKLYRYIESPSNTSSSFYLVTNIEWDADDEEDIEDLPTEVCIPEGDLNPYGDGVEDAISEWLASTYGFCHKGFQYEDGV